MKRIFSLLAVAGVSLSVLAQTDAGLGQAQVSQYGELLGSSRNVSMFQYWKEHDIFQHLDVSLTAGTAGVGLEVSSPIGEYVRLRAGYEFMPRFEKSMQFELTIGGQPARKYDSNGNRVETTFDRLKDMLYDFTGYDINDHVDMIGKPTVSNAKLLVDVYPLKHNKHWHVTAGVYWGPSEFAMAVNSTEAMVSLLSVGIYNRMYEKALNNEPIINPEHFGLPDVGNYSIDGLNQKLIQYGRLGFTVGYYKNDVYATYKADVKDDAGTVIHQKGETYLLHKAGDRYILEPDADGLVRVKGKSNALKPYVGFGYEGRLVRNRDDWKVAVDCGAMFWGGTPDLYVHDGINLTKDLTDVSGQVGTYVDMFKAFKVYPVLGIRFTKTIF